MLWKAQSAFFLDFAGHTTAMENSQLTGNEEKCGP